MESAGNYSFKLKQKVISIYKIFIENSLSNSSVALDEVELENNNNINKFGSEGNNILIKIKF
jgi:hypothetical protein